MFNSLGADIFFWPPGKYSKENVFCNKNNHDHNMDRHIFHAITSKLQNPLQYNEKETITYNILINAYDIIPIVCVCVFKTISVTIELMRI